MFVGEYCEELYGDKVHFPFDKSAVEGWHCYLLEYEGGEHRFITVAQKNEDCEDGEVKTVNKLSLEFDGDCMLFPDEMRAHLSLDNETVIFCGVGKYIDIMSHAEYEKSLEFAGNLDGKDIEKLLSDLF